MRVLAIETSCDETAIAILECGGDKKSARFETLGNALLSQAEVHRGFGGVFPALAKREHAKNLVPLLEAALEEAELVREDTQAISEGTRAKISTILAREPGLSETFLDFISECEVPDIDAIAVTHGPGLEPALWVGVNFAKALALVWNKPVIAVNHMEGHVISALASRNHAVASSDDSAGIALARSENDMLEIKNTKLPILALLISGGHTELVVMKEWLTYELIGQTRDDAVGEAFDKVARMLGLPYPGGPEISNLAEAFRQSYRDIAVDNAVVLPRPMIDSTTCDFSFAGLKTAVLYLLRDQPDAKKEHVAHEFENAVADVLWAKTKKAIDATGAKTLVIGGGVSANIHIRRIFEERIAMDYPEIALRIPSNDLTTDNAIMIAIAGFYRAIASPPAGGFADSDALRADGNLSLASK